MTLRREDSELVEKRDEILSHDERLAVAGAFQDMRDALRLYGLPAANDDRAASLEAALIRYVIASRKPSPADIFGAALERIAPTGLNERAVRDCLNFAGGLDMDDDFDVRASLARAVQQRRGS